MACRDLLRSSSTLIRPGHPSQMAVVFYDACCWPRSQRHRAESANPASVRSTLTHTKHCDNNDDDDQHRLAYDPTSSIVWEHAQHAGNGGPGEPEEKQKKLAKKNEKKKTWAQLLWKRDELKWTTADKKPKSRDGDLLIKSTQGWLNQKPQCLRSTLWAKSLWAQCILKLTQSSGKRSWTIKVAVSWRWRLDSPYPWKRRPPPPPPTPPPLFLTVCTIIHIHFHGD